MQPPAGSEHAQPREYDLEADMYLAKSSIEWASPEHDLTLKAPREIGSDPEEFDELPSLGSFFHVFTDEGEDQIGVCEMLLEWFSHATEYAAGLTALEADSDEEQFSDDESDDDDPTKEIDLSDDERRPNKKPKKA